MKTILITGGAGFVGANLAIYLKKHLKDVRLVCLDNLVRPGSSLNVDRLADNNIEFIKGDIRNKEDLFALQGIDVLVDCSAEPSVLAAYSDPQYTIDTNLIGTLHCLELAKREKAGFLFLSTSRVYPKALINQIPHEEKPTRYDWIESYKDRGISFEGLDEQFPLEGARSLYGATKLCSEQIALEYFDMFGMKGVINRLGIIAGPWQMGKVDQGLVGFWVAQHKYGNPLRYIGYEGSGKQVRDAVHVDDVCDLLLYQLRHMDQLNGRLFNVGGGRQNTFSLLELTGLVQKVTNKTVPIDKEVRERESDVIIYMTDNALVEKTTGWRPTKSIEDIVIDVNEWMEPRISELEPILSDVKK